MRLNSKFAALVFTTLAAACGGGNSNPVVIIDAPEEVDAPTFAECPVCGPDSPCTLMGAGGPQEFTGIPGLIFAQAAMDANNNMMLEPSEITPLGPNICGANGTDPCDFFVVPESGAQMGVNSFFLLANLLGEGLEPLSTGDPANEILMGIELTTGAGGTFIAPRTANFTTNPGAIEAISFLAMPMGTVTYEAIVYVGVVQGTSISNLYMSTSGSVSIKESTNGPNMGSVIKGTVNQTNLSETDGMTLGGCTSSIESLDFGITQGSATFAKPKAPTGSKMSAEVFYQKIKEFKKRQ